MRKALLITTGTVGTLVIAYSMYAAGINQNNSDRGSTFDQVRRLVDSHKPGELNRSLDHFNVCEWTPALFFKDEGLHVRPVKMHKAILRGQTCVYDNGLKITYAHPHTTTSFRRSLLWAVWTQNEEPLRTTAKVFASIARIPPCCLSPPPQDA